MVDIVSVSLYVCVCIQPKLENVNKITSLWLSWPARMHLDALDLWLPRVFGLKNNGAEQRFVSKSPRRKNNENDTVWKRWSSVCAYACVHLSHWGRKGTRAQKWISTSRTEAPAATESNFISVEMRPFSHAQKLKCTGEERAKHNMNCNRI